LFGPGWSIPHLKSFKKQDGIVFLDEGKVTLDSVTVAGVSGTIGNPSARSDELKGTSVSASSASPPPGRTSV